MVNDNYEFRFSEIAADNISGASAILLNTLKVVTLWLTENSLSNKKNLLDLLWNLYEKRPEFVVLYHFISSFSEKLEESRSAGELIKFVEIYREEWEGASQEIYRHLTLLLEKLKADSIFLHSYSSTITNYFENYPEGFRPTSIIQTVSHPAGEGKIQAEALANAGIPITLIEDSALHPYLRKCKAAIVGADIIFGENFMNKIGTMPIALACRFHKVPLIVLSDSRKILPSNFPEKYKDKITGKKLFPPEEILNGNTANISPENLYFEWTPLEYADFLVTEKWLVG